MVSFHQLWFDGTFASSCMRLRKRKSPGFLFPVQMAASGDGRREVISEAPSLSHRRAWETERLRGGDCLQPVSNTFIQAVGETNPPLLASPPTAPYLAEMRLLCFILYRICLK